MKRLKDERFSPKVVVKAIKQIPLFVFFLGDVEGGGGGGELKILRLVRLLNTFALRQTPNNASSIIYYPCLPIGPMAAPFSRDFAF